MEGGVLNQEKKRGQSQRESQTPGFPTKIP